MDSPKPSDNPMSSKPQKDIMKQHILANTSDKTPSKQAEQGSSSQVEDAQTPTRKRARAAENSSSQDVTTKKRRTSHRLRIKKLQGRENLITDNINQSRKIVDSLQNLDGVFKSQYERFFTVVETCANGNLISKFPPISRNQMIEALDSMSEKMLQTLQEGDIQAITTYAQEELQLPWLPKFKDNKALSVVKDVSGYSGDVMEYPMIKSSKKFEQLEDAIQYVVKCLKENKRKIMIFDLHGTLVDPMIEQDERTISESWIKDMKRLMDKGILDGVGIATGGSIDEIERCFDNAGPLGESFRSEVDMFGQYAIYVKGPVTNGLQEFTDKGTEIYKEEINTISEEVNQALRGSKALDDLRSKGVDPDIIQVDVKELSASVLPGRHVDVLKEKITEKAKEDSTIDVEETYNDVNTEVKRILNEVVEKHPNFEVRGSKFTRIDIRLNPKVTGVYADKRQAVVRMTEHYRAESLFTFGDSKEDIIMEKMATWLKAVNEFAERYRPDNKSRFVQDLISTINESHKLNLSQEEIQSIASDDASVPHGDLSQTETLMNAIRSSKIYKTRRGIEEEMSIKASLIHDVHGELKACLYDCTLPNTLQNHGLVGVAHKDMDSKQRKEEDAVRDEAITMVDEISGTVAFIGAIAHAMESQD
jgi:hydroxymethylpyrimidine pyrophosphatase-like HAD family hydrolase